MTVVEEALIANYLGKSLEEVSASFRMSKKVHAKLVAFEEKLRVENNLEWKGEEVSVIDALFIMHQHGCKSMHELSEQSGLSRVALATIFDAAGFPRLTHGEATEVAKRINKGFFGIDLETGLKWGTRAGQIGGAVTKSRGSGIFGLSEEENRENRSKGGTLSKQNGHGIHALTKEQLSESRKRGGRTTGNMLKENNLGIFGWSEEQKLENARRAGKAAFEQNAGIFDPASENMFLSTIHGERKDVGFNARSMMEANVYRALLVLGFSEITPHVEVRIGDKVHSVDFRAVSMRGRTYYYEITVPHYAERKNEEIGMFKELHRDKKLVAIDKSKYKALHAAFKDRSKGDARVIGWETRKDNLKRKPEKWKITE